ncbi:MAG: sigma-70 family RNA polymerase sigma factor [Chitinophagaceae bacterium]|nr:sigma-70 family RNA polymerase sigma factor [Chitinophagaceae bacterium]
MRTHQNVLDNDLVRLFQNGDELALEALIARYKDKIFSTIFYLVKDRHLAEDLFQEVFIKIIDKLRSNSYNEEGKFLHWALRISHNLCVDHFRKEKRNNTTSGDSSNLFDMLEICGDAADTKIVNGQIQEKVRVMLDLLPYEQREVIILRHFAELSFKEIAQLTNTSINTALGRMRYGLINLRKMMEENHMVL